MDTGPLDMLHNAGNKDILAVVDGIDLDLTALNILIDKNRILNTLREDYLHVLVDVIVVESDDHILSAENIGRS